jgi:hypothetical protein
MKGLYSTPESKREMGESVLASDVRRGMEWLEAAAAQEAGVEGEFRAALRAWEARRPRARDFVPPDVRRSLVEREARELQRAREEVRAIWGGVFE